MTLVLVRDDDANATTDPRLLEQSYDPLLAAGVPVCFAVIPKVTLDVRDPEGRREAFLAADAGTEGVRALEAASPLAAWLRRTEGATDVFVHGLTHGRLRAGTELGALSFEEAAARVGEARRLLGDALGRVPIGFVAPWDAVSRGALAAVTHAFDLFSTGFVDRRRLPPLAWIEHARERMRRDGALAVGRGWVLRHGGCKITGETRPDDVRAIVDGLCQGARIAVIVLHHWHFGTTDLPHPVIRALATALRGRRMGNVRSAVRELDGG